MKITLEQLQEFGLAYSNVGILKQLVYVINTYGDSVYLNTINRISHFLGQTAVESGYYSVLEENLNYSAKRLVAVWPNWFKSIATATPYANNPEKLGNYIYGSTTIAKSLGNKKPSDGYKYKGRGIKQLTGLANHVAFNTWIHKQFPDAPDFVKNPEKLKETDWAVWSAVYFWVEKKVYLLADEDDVLAVTKRINGGTNGLKDRTVATNKARRIFATVKPSVLKETKPSKADKTLKLYQGKLKEIADYKGMPEFDPGKVDGWHGEKTESAVRAFQKSANLKIDGVLGKETMFAIDNVLAIIQVGKGTTIEDDLEDAETPTTQIEQEEVPVPIPNKLLEVLDKPLVQDKSIWTLATGGGAITTFIYNVGARIEFWFRSLDPIVQVTILILAAISFYLLFRNVIDFYKARKGLKELIKKNNAVGVSNR